MDFKEEILLLENLDFKEDFIIKKGTIPILFSAPHTMEQIRSDGSIKPSETFTKAIALFLNKYFDTSYIVKIKDTGMDSNRDNHDDYKESLLKFVKENDIKLVIDLHGSKKERDFDVEFGTLNNLTAEFSTIRELEESFIENGVTNIKHNDPFKGGSITQYLYNLKNVDTVQLEINGKYRDIDNIENLEKIIKALSEFIKQYNEYIKR